MATRPIGDFPALREAIAVADRIVGPKFQRADAAALKYRRFFYRSSLAIIFGGVLAAALGLGAALSGQDVTRSGVGFREVLALFEVAVTGALGTIAFLSSGLKWQRKYLRRRWAAETLRGERFRFIGRIGEYGTAPDPERVLKRRLVEVERAPLQKGEAADA